MAAVAGRHSQTALGAFYRAKARQKDGGVAAFATARRIATYIYPFLRWGMHMSTKALQRLTRATNKTRSPHPKSPAVPH
jgi:hypothetical protein